MTTVGSNRPSLHHPTRPTNRAGEDLFGLPRWVEDELRRLDGHGGRAFQQTFEGINIRVRDAGEMALSSVRIEGAARLPSVQLREMVQRAYTAVFRAGDALAANSWVRMWSFIPDIHVPREEGLNTYHVFNQGRFDAFVGALGSDSAFASRLPTATGVGHLGPDLVIHCLTSATPGVHIENPRQIPAYRYSPRYGPRPPCFARGTIVRRSGVPVLLVGGTASVRNEVSMHPEDLRAQVSETFENLSALTSAARAAWPAEMWRSAPLPWEGFEHLRVYYSREEHGDMLLNEVRERIGPDTDIELIGARLCREELLVEIEGVLNLQRSPRRE